MKATTNTPSKAKKDYWIFAERELDDYPDHTARSGKWLIFVPKADVDEVWKKIMQAVEKGKLGGTAKVSTAKPNPNSIDTSKHVICVYTYDADDIVDVRRVRQALRELEILGKISYKTDDSTFKGKYRKAGDTKISLYYE